MKFLILATILVNALFVLCENQDCKYLNEFLNKNNYSNLDDDCCKSEKKEDYEYEIKCTEDKITDMYAYIYIYI